MTQLTKEQEDLVLSNQNLVPNFAKKYLPYAKTYTYDDLIQVGYIGLIRSAQTFDASKGFQFSTYACRYIQYEILDALRDYDNMVQIPHSMQTIIRKFKEEHQSTGISLKKFADKHHYSKEMISQALLASRQIIYMEEPQIYDDEEFTSLMDLLTDNENKAEQNIFNKEVKEKIRTLLSEFQMQKDVAEKKMNMLKAYYGIDTEQMTQHEIGDMYQLSASRVGQIISNLQRQMYQYFAAQKDLLDTCQEYEIREDIL